MNPMPYAACEVIECIALADQRGLCHYGLRGKEPRLAAGYSVRPLALHHFILKKWCNDDMRQYYLR